MCKNVGNIERVIRVILGLGLVSMAFIGPENKWFLIGVVPLMTGLLGWCPPYAIFGINTCKVDSNSK